MSLYIPELDVDVETSFKLEDEKTYVFEVDGN